MDNALQALGVLAQILGVVLGTMAVMTVGFVLFLDIWAKRATNNRIFCFFVEQRSLFGKLLLIEGSKVHLSKGENKEEYLLDHTKQFWSWWPPGLPKFIQVPVRSHFYVRHNPEPFDPENMDALISAKSLRVISDEAMLKQTWKDVRESTGVRASVRSSTNTWVLILIFITLAIVAYNVYLTTDIQSSFNEISQTLGTSGFVPPVGK